MIDRVLITGARSAAALDLARDFRAAGWEPHLADSAPSTMAQWSKAVHTVHRYPSPRQHGAAFRARIAELAAEHAFALVVPTCEEVFHLATPQLHWLLGDRLYAPDLALLRTLHDKLAFSRAASAWGLPSPESYPVDAPADLAKFRENSARWVFKPRFSRFGDQALIGPDPTALDRLASFMTGPWLAQRRIVGEEACFHAIVFKGRLVAFAAYGSDWRLGGGARFAFEPLPTAHANRLRAIAGQLALQGQIHGQFACDVMFDEDEAPYLLECNPRATSGVHLLSDSGDLARAISAGTTMPLQRAHTAYLGPAMVLFGLPKAIRNNQLTAWRTCWHRGRDVITRPGDRWPLVGALIDGARFAASGLRYGISTNAATTRDIEWNGEELDE